MANMATQVKKLEAKAGDVVEVGAHRYEVVSDGLGGLTLEPAITMTAAEAMEKRGTRPATAEEFEREFGDLPSEGEG